MKMFSWFLHHVDTSADANILSPSTGLKMVTACFSQTMASTDESTWHQNPDHPPPPHQCKNLKFHFTISIIVNYIMHQFGNTLQTVNSINKMTHYQISESPIEFSIN
jgi:hypothetical protein